MIRIVDNKRLDMTQEEFDMYNKIVASYTTISVSGEIYFTNLFESDNSGVITILKPPTQRTTTLEIFLFLITLFNQQHMRRMQSQIDDCVIQIREKLDAIK